MPETKTYSVPNISCNHCAAAILEALEDAPGVSAVEVDVEHKQVKAVVTDLDAEQYLKSRLDQEGYPVRE